MIVVAKILLCVFGFLNFIGAIFAPRLRAWPLVNDDAPEMSAAQALAEAARLRDRFAVADGPMFGAAVQALAAETARACAFPTDEEEA